jgi:hypothetical protein
MASQPCLKCGDETAIGSPLYSSRTKVDLKKGLTGFVCSDCHVGITGHDRGELTEEDVRKLREGASAFAYGLSQHH